ncbi:MAG: hypothetical protein WBZ27_12840 [Pseudolabrys sp.]|jgi:hypothetical protein
MEKFRVLVWCDSCRNDEDGCFGGSAEVIGSAFESWEDAAKAGAEYCVELPYRYRIEQDDPY